MVPLFAVNVKGMTHNCLLIISFHWIELHVYLDHWAKSLYQLLPIIIG